MQQLVYVLCLRQGSYKGRTALATHRHMCMQQFVTGSGYGWGALPMSIIVRFVSQATLPAKQQQ